MNTHSGFQYSTKLYGLNYPKFDDISEIESKLPNAKLQSGFQLVEAIIDQKISLEWHESLNN